MQNGNYMPSYSDYHLVSDNITLADYLESQFDLDKIELPKEYFYSCLPLCLLDAIYSIGVTYTSTYNVVIKYCKKYNIQQYRQSDAFPPADKQHTISQLIENIEETGVLDFARYVVENEQRTSSKNGILKSEAVLNCAKIMQKNGIETLQDFTEKFNESIAKKYQTVKGQGSGIYLAYLKMLCGDSSLLKPDRHIIRFLNGFFSREVKPVEAQKMIAEAAEYLKKKHRNINVRSIDYQIWAHMSHLK